MTSVKKEIGAVVNWYKAELEQLDSQREEIHKMYDVLISKIRKECKHKSLLTRTGQYTAEWMCEDCGEAFDEKPKSEEV